MPRISPVLLFGGATSGTIIAGDAGEPTTGAIGAATGAGASTTGASSGGGARIGACDMPPPRFMMSSMPARALSRALLRGGDRPPGRRSSSASFPLVGAPAFSVAVSAESEKSTEFSLRSPTRRSADVVALDPP